MKLLSTLSLIILSGFIISLIPQQNNGRIENLPKVMLLGTYHMSNPGKDAANIKSDDVKKSERQYELEELTNKLAEFKPTKIVIEDEFGDDYFIGRYKSFLSRKNLDSLSRNEIEQIGFRLAAKLNLKTLYPIDYKMEFYPESYDSLLNNFPDKKKFVDNYISKVQKQLNKWTEEKLYNGSIIEYLAFLNTPELLEYNFEFYLDHLKELYAKNNYAGAEMLANWYERNLIIFQNLTRITDFENPEERILVIFGQGHIKILKDLVQDSDYYNFVDVLNYLKK